MRIPARWNEQYRAFPTLTCLPHEVRTTVAGGAARLSEQATGDRLSLPSRPG